MFIAALFTRVKIWKQLECPSTDECIKKICCVYTMEYFSAIQKDEILPFATMWMDHEGIMLYEMSNGERQIVWFYSYVKYKTTTTTNERSKCIATENTGVSTRGEEGECKIKWVNFGEEGKLNFWWWAHHSLYRSRDYNVVHMKYIML